MFCERGRECERDLGLCAFWQGVGELARMLLCYERVAAEAAGQGQERVGAGGARRGHGGSRHVDAEFGHQPSDPSAEHAVVLDCTTNWTPSNTTY